MLNIVDFLAAFGALRFDSQVFNCSVVLVRAVANWSKENILLKQLLTHCRDGLVVRASAIVSGRQGSFRVLFYFFLLGY